MLANTPKVSTMNLFAPLSEIPPKTFETARLTLRAVELTDCELMFKKYSGDPIITKYMAFPCASRPEDSLPFVKAVASNFAGEVSSHQQFAWLIFRKDSGECIGLVGIGINNPTTLGGGYGLSQDAWGKGFAAEAWQPIVEWAKSQPQVQRIEAKHHADNAASGSVMRKVGLTCEGIKPKSDLLPNLSAEKVDMVWWAWNRPSTKG